MSHWNWITGQCWLKRTVFCITVITTVKITWGGFACLENPCFHGICIDYLDINSTQKSGAEPSPIHRDEIFQCYCRNGYTGYSCQINWDECKFNPCLNNGICTDGIANFNCSCVEPWSGSLCQYDLSACEEIFPCQNNGTCTIDSSSGNETFACLCPVGFNGPQCELDISICNTTQNTCLNGGKCVDGVGESYYCECEPGWAGLNCQEQIDNCASQPCQSGGICVNRLNDFGCACPFGYTGKVCEKKLKICEVNPCKNGAFCLHEHEDESRTCYCVPDFHGELCEFKYDDCSPLPKCYNGGTCIDGVGNFSCSCPPNYFGTTCQCTTENMTDPACYYNQTTFPPASEILPYSSNTIPFVLPTKFPEHSELTSGILEGTVIPSISSSLTQDQEESSTVIGESDIVIIPTVSFSETAFSTESIHSGKPFPTSTIPFPMPSSSYTDIELSISLEGSEGITPSTPMSLFPTPISTWSTVSISEPEPSETLISSISEEGLSIGVFSSSSTFLSITPGDLHSASDFVLSSPGKWTEVGVELSKSLTPTPKPDDEIGDSVTSYSTDSQIHASSIAPGSLSSTPLPSVSITVPPSPSRTQSILFTATLPLSDLIPTEVVTDPTISYEFSTVELESVLPSNYSSLPSPLSTTHFLELSLSPTLPDILSSTIAFSDSIDKYSPSSSITITPEIWDNSSIHLVTPTTPITDIFPPVTVTQSDNLQNYTSATTVISTILVDVDTSSSQLLMSESFSDTFMETSSIADVAWPMSTSVFIQPSISDTATIISTFFIPDPSASSSFYLTTPEPSVTLPSSSPASTSLPPITTNHSQTDPCHNFCYNNGKCVADSIEPFCRCSFKFSGDRCQTPRNRFKTVSFTGDSFLEYKVPNDSINRINIKTTTATNAPDNLLFYTSSSLGRLYALIFTEGGHISLHFSCGSQSMHFVETRTRVDNGYNFTLEFSMEMVVHAMTETEIHCVGQVSVNHSYIMRGEQVVGQNELYDNPIQFIYLGGVDTNRDYTKKSDDLIGILPGFRGCLYRLLINDEPKDLFEDAVDGKQVAECSAFGCVANPCFMESKCVPWNKFPFWQCICSSGFQGVKCQIRVCDSNPCQNGATCTFLLEEGNESSNTTEISEPPKPHCLCPLGYTGSQCQSTTNITKPSFKQIDGFAAFIAYEPIPRFADWVQLKFHFVTRNFTQIALLLYSGSSIGEAELANTNNNEVGTQKVSDFFAITYIHGYLALTWDLGSGIQRIITPGKIDKRLNVHTIFAGHSGKQAWLKVDGMKNTSSWSPGPFYRLNVNTELFLGGYDAFRFEGLPHDLPMYQGFEGCIFDFGFRVKNRLYLPRTLRGRNVKNCYEEDC